MLKTLLKKQFLEINAYYFFDSKKGKMRSKGSIAGTIILFVFLYAVLAYAFLGYASMMGGLIEAGFNWLYYSMMAIVAILLGIFGSVFNTYTGLYLSKDNDMLLSMPIKPVHIIISRVFGVFLMSILYTALVWVPAIIMYVLRTRDVGAIGCGLTVLLCLSFVVTVLTCALGFVIAVASSKLKNQKFITIVISLIFFAAYYFVCFRATNIIQYFVSNGAEIGNTIKSKVYPIYMIGAASVGDVIPLVIFIVSTAVLVFLLFFIMSKTYIRLITTRKGEKKVVYKERAAKASSAKAALLKREASRFINLPTYVLNCGLGVLFLAVGAVAAFVKRAALAGAIGRVTQELPVVGTMLPVICAAIICLVGSLNLISAPSISLEGQSLWIIRSLPVKTRDVLMAKSDFHFYVNAVPMALAAVALCITFSFESYTIWTMLLLVLGFARLTGSLGVLFNLLMPNLVWANESIPIKRGGSIIVSMFANWVIAIVIGGVFYLVKDIISADNYLLVAFAVLLIANRLIERFFAGKGTEMFESL